MFLWADRRRILDNSKILLVTIFFETFLTCLSFDCCHHNIASSFSLLPYSLATALFYTVRNIWLSLDHLNFHQEKVSPTFVMSHIYHHDLNIFSWPLFTPTPSLGPLFDAPLGGLGSVKLNSDSCSRCIPGRGGVDCHYRCWIMGNPFVIKHFLRLFLRPRDRLNLGLKILI